MANVENAIAIARSMIRTGPSRQYCLECGEPIPKARREAVSGCQYCVRCQESHDGLPNLKLVTRML